MKAVIFTKRYIACPRCGQGEKSVDHLEPGREAGPWYCDECGRAFTLKVCVDSSIDVQLSKERKYDTWDLLVLPPQAEPVYFLVPGARYEGGPWHGSDHDPVDSKRFCYEEHSCPTNWLKPEVIANAGDLDPHGLIEFVRYIDAVNQEEETHRQSYEWAEVFPELNGVVEEKP